MGSALSVLPAGAFDNLLLLSPNAPEAVEADLRDRGLDVRTVGLVPISGSRHDYDGPLWTTRTVAPSDLTGVSIYFSQAVEHLRAHTGWVLFENLNVLLMYADEDSVFRLVDHLLSTVRDREVTAAFTVVRDAIDDRTYAKLQNRFDVTVTP